MTHVTMHDIDEHGNDKSCPMLRQTIQCHALVSGITPDYDHAASARAAIIIDIVYA